MWVGFPIASSSGRISSNAATGPPTMMEIVPAFAPAIPPDTGASRQATSGSACASSAASCGPLVERSHTMRG